MRKLIMALILVIAFLAVVLIPLSTLGNTIEAETIFVETGTLAQHLELSGETSIQTTYTASSPLAGKVSEIPVQVGDQVQAGQLVFSLDQSELTSKLKQLNKTQSELEEAVAASTNAPGLAVQVQKQAALEAAQQNCFELNTFNTIMREDAVSATADMSQSLSGETTAELKTIDAQVSELNAQISACKVKSEMKGTVLAINASAGQILAQGTPVVVIGDTSDMIVTAMASETDAYRLSKDMPCTFYLQGQNTEYTGTIESVGSQVISQNSIGTAVTGKMVEVKIRPDQPLNCVAGSTASIYIEVSRAEDALVIPLDAISADSSVFVVGSDDCIAKRLITTGISNDFEVEVLSGLEDGDKIIASMDEEYQEGMKVRNYD